MAQTFDIRFDAAGNSFGWKGGGRLSVDSQGMSFVLKRGLASLLARRISQRIPAENIREVYREGEALRVEFATDENPRVTYSSSCVLGRSGSGGTSPENDASWPTLIA